MTMVIIRTLNDNAADDNEDTENSDNNDEYEDNDVLFLILPASCEGLLTSLVSPWPVKMRCI